jgi:hypothetical protein
LWQARHEKVALVGASALAEQALAHVQAGLFLQSPLAHPDRPENTVDTREADSDVQTSLEHTFFRLQWEARFVHTDDAYLRPRTDYQFSVF